MHFPNCENVLTSTERMSCFFSSESRRVGSLKYGISNSARR